MIDKTKIKETYLEISLTVEYEVEPHAIKFSAYQEEDQTLISGLVKWDGCCHFTFGDEDGYVHVCGQSSIFNLSEAIKKIYFRCGELMPENFKK